MIFQGALEGMFSPTRQIRDIGLKVQVCEVLISNGKSSLALDQRDLGGGEVEEAVDELVDLVLAGGEVQRERQGGV